mgnify:CR=1 FL=1
MGTRRIEKTREAFTSRPRRRISATNLGRKWVGADAFCKWVGALGLHFYSRRLKRTAADEMGTYVGVAFMDKMHVFLSVVQLILNDIYLYFLLRIFVLQLRNDNSFWWVA